LPEKQKTCKSVRPWLILKSFKKIANRAAGCRTGLFLTIQSYKAKQGMEQIPGYIISEKIEQTRSSIVYRGKKAGAADGSTVIIKVLNTENPTPADVARLHREYELVRGVDDDSVARVLDIVEYDGSVALVIEDFEGVALNTVIEDGPMPLDMFLPVAIQITEALGRLHGRNIIHRDIKPYNILFNPQTGKIKLTDFGISTSIDTGLGAPGQNGVIDGTFAYMAPEQTGRMNRPVGSYTDLYSLGVTFYELLTCRLPFDDISDPMEIMHAHMAIRPVPPVELNAAIPPVVSDIVMKLLSKDVEDRYQSAYGLAHDLKRCLELLEKTGKVDRFKIGEKDLPSGFSLPRKLVGREAESEILLGLFRQVKQGNCRLAAVSGDTGVGKTFLVSQVCREIVAKRGLLCSGRFEALRASIPYSGFEEAFQGLIKQILTEPSDRIAAWKESLLTALGENGQLITNIIPELKLIIGEQPEPPPLPGSEEARNRLNYVFKQFVRVFARESHPLTIFLDDLHEADKESLDLMVNLASEPDMGCLFIIVAYRSDAPGLRRVEESLQKIETRGGHVEEVRVEPFTEQQLNSFLALFLRCGDEEAGELAKLVHKKTSGAPLFVNQFLKSIYDKNLLLLDPEKGWIWDAAGIENVDITDNVIELMVDKIEALDEQVRKTLRACSCVGNRFGLEIVADLLDKPVENILADISVAVSEELVRQTGELYRFEHEKIRDAAYSLVPDDERPAIHLRIGKFMLSRTSGNNLADKVFEVVDHFNQALSLLADEKERLNVARLNIMAGEKARSSSAYTSALNYFSTAATLLPDNRWDTMYDVALPLLRQLGECLFLTGDIDGANRVFEEMLSHSRDVIDKVNIYSLIVMLYTAADKPGKALEIGLKALSQMGLKLSPDVGKLRVAWELLRFRISFGFRRVEEAAELPEMTDPKFKAITSLLTAIGVPAYYANPNLFAATVVTGCRLGIVHGLPEFASFGLVPLGMIFGSKLGFYRYGYRLGKTGLKVIERFNDVASFAKSYFVYAYFILPWAEPIKNCFGYLELAYKYGMETGDLIFAGHSLNVTSEYSMFAGLPLDTIFDKHLSRKSFLERLDTPFILNNYLDTYEMFIQLKGLEKRRDDEYLQAKWKEREKLLEALDSEDLQLGMFIHYAKRCMVMFMFGNYRSCFEAAAKAEEVVEYAVGTLYVAELYFYWCLASAKLYDSEKEDNGEKRKHYLKTMKRCIAKYRPWVKNCPENFHHMHCLMRAELARISKEWEKATELYHQALVSARESGFLQNEGLAAELAAGFHFSRGYDEFGKACVLEAKKAYSRWGASAKVRQLEHLYSMVWSVEQVMVSPSETSSSITTSLVDISALRKALKAIAEENVHTRMVERIIRSAVEFAGAQKGVLIFSKGGGGEGPVEQENLFVEAEWSVDSPEIEIMHSIPLNTKKTISHTVVNYVARTKNNVVIHDAQEPHSVLPSLHKEDYIKANGIKSILCMPITVTTKGDANLIGVFYFENNLTSNAFTRDRIETLEIISLSAAGRLELSRKAVTDGLTGLYNHDYFQNMLQQELLLSARKGRSLSLVMIDIDHFKKFNDTWGHQAGDKVLQEVAAELRASCRGSDVVARYGGEEMAILLHETDPQDAVRIAEKIRSRIESLPVVYGDETLHVTISLGVAGFPVHAKNRKQLIKMADDALYCSKSNGRNRVTMAADGLS